jgi:polysaccharide export outer membrane protein
MVLRLCGAAFIVLMGGCAAPQGAVPQSESIAAKQANETSDYVIGPGDVLSVFVYERPELSVTDLPVRPDGRISIPLASDIVAAGLTPSALASAISQKLGKYEKDPNVTVMVRNFLGPFDRQIRVIGQATDPMAIPYREHMTVLDVMIQTKGLTRFAAGNRSVLIRRTAGGPPIRIDLRLADLIKDGDLSQNMEMQPGDTLIIPQTWF